MKKKILVMLLACSMLAGTAACGKDNKADSNAQAQKNGTTESVGESIEDSSDEEPFVGMEVESTLTIELGEDEEGAFAP